MKFINAIIKFTVLTVLIVLAAGLKVNDQDALAAVATGVASAVAMWM